MNAYFWMSTVLQHIKWCEQIIIPHKRMVQYSIHLHYLVCYSSDVYIRPWLYSLVGVKASKNKHSMLTVNFIHTAWITSNEIFISSVDIINIMIIGIQSSLTVCYNYNSSNIWVCQFRNDFLKQESRCWQAEERK